MRTVLHELAKYFVASACALVVDISLLWSLVQFFAWEYLVAACTSFLAGAVVAYGISVNLVFKQRRIRDRRAEFIGFIAIGLVGLTVNAGVIYVCVQFFHAHILLAKGVAAAFTFICNFIARRQLLFVASGVRREEKTYAAR